MSITLTVAEIIDLAGFAGLTLNSAFTPTDEDDLASEVTIKAPPMEGVYDEENKRYIKTKHIAFMADYPEEGCVPLGPELKA